jgi:opacity protein-like surface antigen
MLAHPPSRVPSVGTAVAPLLVLLVGASSCATPSAEQRAAAERRFDVLLGMRLSSDALPDVPDYDDLDQAAAFGLEFAYQSADDFVGFEVGFASALAQDEELRQDPGGALYDLDLELFSTELYGGAVKTFGIGEPFRPYIGLGLALVALEGEVSSAVLGGSDTQSDYSPAGYLHGGALFDVSPCLALGLDLRWLFGTQLELDDLEVDGDYLQAAFVLGFHF